MIDAVDRFMDLTDDEQDQIIRAIQHRRHVRYLQRDIANKVKIAAAELEELRETCQHLAVQSTYLPNEDEFGRRLSGNIMQYNCPDCEKVWRSDD